MRILLTAALVAAGVLVGAAVPAVSQFVRGVLASAGLPPTVPTFAAGPGPASPGEPRRDAGDRHDPGQATPARTAEPKISEPKTAEPRTAEPKTGDGHAHGGHAHAEAEAEEGHVTMTAEQIEGQAIKVAKAEGGLLSRHILVPGTITTDADRIARVPARVVGTVSEMRKRLGDDVRKGDVVAVLDSREVADAKSEYLTALVQSDLQKINFERQQRLLASAAASQAAFDNAKATFQENQLRVDLARQKLSALGLNAAEVAAAQKRDEATPNASTLRQYELRAPISGRIVARKVDVGTAVGKEGDPADVYTVADLSTVWIELAVPTSDLDAVREGARVTVNRGGRSEEGKVVFVSPLLNAETRSARVVVSLPNADMAWRPGTYVTAEVETEIDRVPVRVAKASLQTVAGKRVVFVRTGEGFEKRPVELGRSDDDAYEVVSGLKPGEDIAVANTFLLKAELGKSEADHDH